jgi:hypothetical protein
VTFTTMDGEHVRAISTQANPGLNRVMWDLRYEASSAPRLRTPALEHSHRDVGASGFRAAPDGGSVRPLAVPGRYRVTLEVSGQDAQTAVLEVLQDPDSEASAADMRAQLDLQLELREMSVTARSSRRGKLWMSSSSSWRWGSSTCA